MIKTTESEEIPAKIFYTPWGRKHISTWNSSAENSNLKSFHMFRGEIWLWREALHLIYNYQRVTWQQTCLQVEAQYSILQLSWTSHSTLKGFISNWRQEGEAPVQSSRTRLKTDSKCVCVSGAQVWMWNTNEPVLTSHKVLQQHGISKLKERLSQKVRASSCFLQLC